SPHCGHILPLICGYVATQASEYGLPLVFFSLLRSVTIKGCCGLISRRRFGQLSFLNKLLGVSLLDRGSSVSSRQCAFGGFHVVLSRVHRTLGRLLICPSCSCGRVCSLNHAV